MYNVHQVYEGVMRWVKHDLDTRQVFLSELLSAVRLPLISSKYLVDHIEKVNTSNALQISISIFIYKLYQNGF